MASEAEHKGVIYNSPTDNISGTENLGHIGSALTEHSNQCPQPVHGIKMVRQDTNDEETDMPDNRSQALEMISTKVDRIAEPIASKRFHIGIKTTISSINSSLSKSNSQSDTNELHIIEDENVSTVNEDEAYATSTAIIGESVMDLPYQAPTSLLDENGIACTSNRTDGSRSNLPDTSKDSAGGDTEKKPMAEDELAQSMSVGMVAQGLAWARKQRERRQRQYLQNQAELQIRKIRLAQEKEEKERLERRAVSLADNPTFQNFMKKAAFSTGGFESSESKNGNDDSSLQSTFDMLRGYFFSSSSGNRSFSNSSSFDESNKSHQVLESKVTRSECGGYSVQLPISSDKEDNDDSWIPPVRVEPNDRDRNSSTFVPYLLTLNEMQQIAHIVLPPGIAYCPWSRLYSLARDGDSFDACLRLMGAEKQTLLVIRTRQNEVFGGFADTAWNHALNQSGPAYFGGPNSCLFCIENFSNDNQQTDTVKSPLGSTPESTGGTERRKKRQVICYKWTGANRYILLCDPSSKMLAFGGGGDNGAFGLCIEDNFQFGSTGSCETFDNEPLSKFSSFFDIVDMEVWGFLVGQF